MNYLYIPLWFNVKNDNIKKHKIQQENIVKRKEYSEKKFDCLIDRAIEYLGFLKRNAHKADKSEWCKKLIAPLN